MDDLGDFIAFDAFFGGSGSSGGSSSGGADKPNGCQVGCLTLLLLFIMYEIYVIYLSD